MTFRNLFLVGAALLMASPMFASTYYGGFEDLRNGDYDYNDLVFSLSGSKLSLKTSDGAWFSEPAVNNNAKPFWDNLSGDGDKKNVGYCIYGGGTCGSGIDPDAKYLGDKSHKNLAADDVYFSTRGAVESDLILSIASATDVLGWYNVSSPNIVHLFNTNGGTGSYSFNPHGDFGLIASNGVDSHSFYYSQDKYGIQDSTSHFAFFQAEDMQPTPEPGTMGVMGGGLMLVGAFFRSRKVGGQK